MNSLCNSSAQIYMRLQVFQVQHSRHDPREMENLSRQVGHVAVEEHKEWLDHTGVRCEPGGEGRDQPIQYPHEDTSQGHHEETDDSQEDIHERYRSHSGVLLKQMVQHLCKELELRFNISRLHIDCRIITVRDQC